MPQSRLMSMTEAITNVVVGFLLAVGVQLVVFPPLGVDVTFQNSMLMGSLFTAVSVARSYTLRRLFEAIGTRLWRRRF